MAARKMTKADGLYFPTKTESRANNTKPTMQVVTPPNGHEENAQHHVEEACDLFPVMDGGQTDDALDPHTFSSIMASLIALEDAQKRNLHDLQQVRRMNEENLNKQREQQAQLEAILILMQTKEATGKTGQATPSLK